MKRWLYVWLIVVVVLFLATGCATCRKHPGYCAVAAAVVAGCIVASVDHNHDPQPAFHRTPIDLK